MVQINFQILVIPVTCLVAILIPFSMFSLLLGKKENNDTLSWAERYKVAVGVAEALDYLHGGGSAQPVIHRDVKSSNILLSDDFDPQVLFFLSIIIDSEYLECIAAISFLAHILPGGMLQLADFGLALWASTSSSHMTCNEVAGTFGFVILLLTYVFPTRVGFIVMNNCPFMLGILLPNTSCMGRSMKRLMSTPLVLSSLRFFQVGSPSTRGVPRARRAWLCG